MPAPKRTDVVPVISLAGLLCAAYVILLPSTRDVAGAQARMLFEQPGASLYILRVVGVKNGVPQSDKTAQDAQLKGVTQKYPNAAPLQIAAALHSANSLRQLRALTLRFPNNAALRAHILRISAMTLHPGHVPDAETAALYDGDAVHGERLEPNNAYFPMMQAMGLAAQQKDDQAIAILLRAADKTGWDDHTSEEGPTVIRLVEEAFGPTTVLDQVVIQDAILFPHLAALRGMERSVIADAQAKENAGQVEAGFRERHAILRLGHLMRTQGRTGMAAIVGALIARSCVFNPGGPVGNFVSNGLPSKPTLLQRQAAYVAYLQRIGHGEEASAVMQECAADAQTEPLINAGLARSPLNANNLRQVAAQWCINLALLANALAVLSLWFVALALTKTRRTEGVVPTLALALALALFLLLALQTQWAPVFGILRDVVVNLMLYLPGDTASGSANNPLSNPGALHISGVVASLLAPVTILICVAFTGFVRRTASFAFVINGLARWGGVMAGGLLFLYAVTLVTTVRSEARARDAFLRTAQHEGRYLAAVQHRSWPQ